MNSEEIKMNISKNICRYREKAGLSQRQLAQRLNIVPSRISNWETGANCPSIDILFRLCEVLDISINDIYGVYPDANIKLSSEELDMVYKYRNLDSNGKSYVNLVIERETDRTLHETQTLKRINQYSLALSKYQKTLPSTNKVDILGKSLLNNVESYHQSEDK